MTETAAKTRLDETPTTLQESLSERISRDTVQRAKALPMQLPPQLAHAIDPEVLIENPTNFDLQSRITLGAGRRPRGIAPPGNIRVVGGWSDRQNPADRLDPYTSRCSSINAIID